MLNLSHKYINVLNTQQHSLTQFDQNYSHEIYLVYTMKK